MFFEERGYTMIPKGHTIPFGLSLYVGVNGWSISIRRVDGKTENSFCAFHNKPVLGKDIRDFVPNYAKLNWQEINKSLLGYYEVTAEDGLYRINLIRHDQNLTKDKMLQEFLDFMESTVEGN
jgi:hypothetical protein